MREITLNIDGKEIKAMVSKEEIEKLTTQEPSVRLGFAGSILKKARENERARKEWPQIGDRYYWTTIYGSLQDKIFEGNSDEETLISNGNMYRTKQEALDSIRAKKLIAAVARRRKELNGNWVPDWEDNGGKQQIVFWAGEISIDTAYSSIIASPFGVYKTKTSAQTIIDEFRDELEWYFTEYIVSVN